MKKNYKNPRMRAVELKASNLLSDSTTPMNVELNDYSTYEDTPRTPSSSVDWSGTGTGSDF